MRMEQFFLQIIYSPHQGRSSILILDVSPPKPKDAIVANLKLSVGIPEPEKCHVIPILSKWGQIPSSKTLPEYRKGRKKSLHLTEQSAWYQLDCQHEVVVDIFNNIYIFTTDISFG